MAIRLRYPELAPDGYAALSSLGHYVNTATTLTPVLLGMIYLRASHLNKCAFCITMHSAELRKLNEPQTRIDAVAQWEAEDAFTPRERAALRWTDVLTMLPTGSHASDEDYAAVTEFFKEKDVVDLTLAIATINAWNRLGVAFRPEWKSKPLANATAKTVPNAASEERLSGADGESNQSVIDDDGKVAQDQ